MPQTELDGKLSTGIKRMSAPTPDNPRKIVQIASASTREQVGDIAQSWPTVYALCNDGTVWGLDSGALHELWHQLPKIPQAATEL